MIHKLKLLDFFAVFLGGMFGAVARFLISLSYFDHFEKNSQNIYLFPFDILLINVVGSFCLGLFLSYFQKNNLLLQQCGGQVRNFFAVGFLGAFTTFSTFILDNLVFAIPLLIKINFLAQQEFYHKILESWVEIIPLTFQTFILENALLLILINTFANLFLCIFMAGLGYRIYKN